MSGLRALHSLIHVTYNRVMHRFLVYVSSTVLLFGMWIAFAAEDHAMSDFEGRCLCGAVKFSITAPTLFFAHCHCHYCREAHGAAFVSWVGAAEERFRLLPGSREPRWYQSSQQSRRGFCENCGTTLFFASTLCPGEIHVTRASIPGTHRPRAAVPRVL